MNNSSLASFTALIALSLVSCQGAFSQKSEPLKLPKFATPPTTITDPQARAAYILKHVWTDYEVIDSTMFADRGEAEQFLVNYFAVADVAGTETMEEVSGDYFAKGDTFADSVMVAMADKYFGTAASPLFSDELYLSVMEPARKAGVLTDAQKVILADHIRLMGMNKVGSPAPDFAFLTLDGKSHRFSELKGKPTVLLLYNIGCSTCHSLMQFLSDHSSYRRWVEEGKINFLAITSSDQLDMWKGEQQYVPDYALSGLDSEMTIIRKELIDVRAYPTLYFFDKDMKVLAKDIHVDDLTDLISETILKGE